MMFLFFHEIIGLSSNISIISQQILGTIAHNVSAVYDVLAARIRALRSKDQGRQNVGGVSRGKERSD
jgi:hypothetical protein